MLILANNQKSKTMKKYKCLSCQTAYSSSNGKPSGVKWSDGHVCKPEPVKEVFQKTLVELSSVGCWIDSKTGTVYPCRASGLPDFLAGSELEDLDVEWVTVLDKNDLENFAQVLYSIWDHKYNKNLPI